MPIDIYSPVSMMALIREKPTVFSFCHDRYFSDNPTLFKTEKVIVDYDDGEGNLMAPFVIPHVGNVPMLRGGYTTKELEPAYIAPSRPLSIDDLTKRRAGESIVSTQTPEQRERLYLMDDLDFLDRAISRREEWMCVNTMLDNKCVMKHIGDSTEKGQDFTARFYEGNDNPGVVKPSAKWEIGTETKRGNWYDDICRWVAGMAESGRSVSDLVVGAEVGDFMMADPWVYKMLDNRRFAIGEIDPRWQPNGVVVIGNLNFGGIALDIFCYRGTYEVRDGKDIKKFTAESYFPTKGTLLAAPNTGHMSYAAVTQIEQDQKTHTRFGTRIPKHNVNVQKNIRETILTARPIASPYMKAAWRGCRDALSGT